MSIEAVSPTPTERSRKAHSAVLRALQENGKAAAIAVALGVSESTVSRIKSEKIEDVLSLLYHAGFKCVPSSYVCVDRAVYEAVTTIAARAMASVEILQALTVGGIDE